MNGTLNDSLSTVDVRCDHCGAVGPIGAHYAEDWRGICARCARDRSEHCEQIDHRNFEGAHELRRLDDEGLIGLVGLNVLDPWTDADFPSRHEGEDGGENQINNAASKDDAPAERREGSRLVEAGSRNGSRDADGTQRRVLAPSSVGAAGYAAPTPCSARAGGGHACRVGLFAHHRRRSFPRESARRGGRVTTLPTTQPKGPMNATKDWYQSLTINAAIASMICFIAGKLGYAIEPGAAQTIVEWLSSIGFGLSALLTIVGRVRATHQIATSDLPKPPNYGGTLALLVAGLLASAMTIGCAGAPTSNYVLADRATYNAISPTYRSLLDGSLPLSDIDAQERAAINDTLDTWDMRIRSAETPSTQPAP